MSAAAKQKYDMFELNYSDLFEGQVLYFRRENDVPQPTKVVKLTPGRVTLYTGYLWIPMVLHIKDNVFSDRNGKKISLWSYKGVMPTEEGSTHRI